jgi:methylmalonyl-CoA mutase
MSLALERAWRRHVPEVRSISKVYAEAAHGAEAFEQARRAVIAFAESDGRPPRILVAKIGQDGHDRGQKVIASAFADLGFEVEVGQLFATPEEVAAAAIDANVHVVGISSLTAGHMTLIPALKRALGEGGRSDIAIVVGGIVPPEDVAALAEMGVLAVFPPGTSIPAAAQTLLDRLNERLGYAQKAAE